MAALILLAHGSPDPEWIRPIERTADHLRALAPAYHVATATLDGDSFASTVATSIAAGHDDIRVLAYFMSPGGRHLKRDIPELVEAARAGHPGATITLIPGALGVADEVLDAIARAALRLGGDALEGR